MTLTDAAQRSAPGSYPSAIDSTRYTHSDCCSVCAAEDGVESAQMSHSWPLVGSTMTTKASLPSDGNQSGFHGTLEPIAMSNRPFHASTGRWKTRAVVVASAAE